MGKLSQNFINLTYPHEILVEVKERRSDDPKVLIYIREPQEKDLDINDDNQVDNFRDDPEVCLIMNGDVVDILQDALTKAMKSINDAKDEE